jgi:7-cyano-7-deazaguanine synthase in queuosine biosynthesis
MVLKYAFAAAISVGALFYGIQETKEQVFYDCQGAFGQAAVVNTNRYSSPDVHIKLKTPDGQIQRYDYIHAPEFSGMATEAVKLCRTGRSSEKLRIRI